MIAAARAAGDTAGVPLFIDARIDTFLRGAGGVDLTLEGFAYGELNALLTRA